MMSHSNNCCVVHEPAICEDLDLHVAIFLLYFNEVYYGMLLGIITNTNIFGYIFISLFKKKCGKKNLKPET